MKTTLYHYFVHSWFKPTSEESLIGDSMTHESYGSFTGFLFSSYIFKISMSENTHDFACLFLAHDFST